MSTSLAGREAGTSSELLQRLMVRVEDAAELIYGIRPAPLRLLTY